jgi:hypothetical protein
MIRDELILVVQDYCSRRVAIVRVLSEALLTPFRVNFYVVYASAQYQRWEPDKPLNELTRTRAELP